LRLIRAVGCSGYGQLQSVGRRGKSEIVRKERLDNDDVVQVSLTVPRASDAMLSNTGENFKTGYECWGGTVPKRREGVTIEGRGGFHYGQISATQALRLRNYGGGLDGEKGKRS